MRYVLLFTALLCLGTNALARLGDTRARADERYGVAHTESPAIREEALVEGAHHAIYHFEGFEIYCAFLKATDGQSYSVRERYQRLSSPASVQPRPSPVLEGFEVNAFLTTQGGGAAWRKSDRTALSDLAPEWLRDRLRSYRIGTLWTRKDGAIAEGRTGGRWITFSHPQSLVHEAQLQHGGAVEEKAAVEQFIAAISQTHRVAASSSAPSDVPAVPMTQSTDPAHSRLATSRPLSESGPTPRSTTGRAEGATDPKEGVEDLNHTLRNAGVVGVLVIGVVRLVVAGLKGSSRRGSKRSPLRQSPRSAPPPLRAQPERSVAPRRQNTLDDLEWDEFELLVGEIYRRQGYHVEISSGDGADGGIDLVLRRDGETVLVQCKHWQTSKVGAKEIREFYGVLVSEGSSRGIFVTTHEYSRDALDFAAGKPMELISRGGLAELIVMGQRSDMADLLDIPEWAPFFKSSSQVLVPTCPYCKTTMLLRNSKGGPFWGCRCYPKCRGIRKTKRYLVGQG